MSQDRAFSLSTARTGQDSSKRTGTLSFAGPKYLQQPPTNQRAQSFVAPDYETYHAGYDVPDEPVWSLAKPWPHLMRPGMKARERKFPESRLQDPEAQEQRTTKAASLPTSLGRTPSNADQKIVSRIQSQPQDLLRTATSNARDRKHRSPGSQINEELPQTSTHDFVQDTEQDDDPKNLQLTRSELDQMDAGRQRLQEYADAFAHLAATQDRPNPDVDWEEFLQKQTTALPQRTQSATPTEPKFFNTWGKWRYSYRECLAEFLGTFIFMIFGLSASVVPQIATTNPSGAQYGDFLTSSLAWSWGGMIGIYIAGGVSGGHLNPAASITLSIYRGFPWRSCWKYIIVQLLACFLAGFIVYALYSDAIVLAIRNQASSDSSTSTCQSKQVCLKNIFYATPKDSLPTATVFFSQFLSSALFATCVFALGDDRNAPPGAGMNAFVSPSSL